MDSKIGGICMVLLATLLACLDAYPSGLPTNTTNHQVNVTREMTNAASSTTSDTISDIAKSISASIFDVIKDCLTLEQNLAASLPQGLRSVSVPFAQLQLDPISCTPFQIVDRVKRYRQSLVGFTTPMNAMVNEGHWAATQRRLLIKLSYSMVWLSLHQVKMLESFEADGVRSTVSPSVGQLEVITRAYLANNFPKLRFTDDQVKVMRSLSLVKALASAVETMQLETRLAMSLTN